MSNKDTFPFWSDDWMKSQQEYLDTWTDMSEKMASTFQVPKKPRNPWVEALEQWESVVPANSDAQPYAQRMLDQGKAFFQMTEEVSTFMRVLDDVNKSTDDWQKTLKAQMEEVKGAFEKGQGDLSAFWDQPLTAWKDMAGEQANPQAFLKAMGVNINLDDIANPAYDSMNKLLSTPGVGPDRESQEQQLKYSRVWMEYQRTFKEYNTAHHRVGQETIERLIDKTVQLSEKGETLDSMREVYDLWIDCAEDAYADFAYSDEYQDIYGRMINSQMAMKKETRGMIDDAVSSMGLPSSRGFDTVLERMQEMRREIRQLKKSSKPASGKATSNNKELNELRAEIKELRNEFAKLQQSAKSTVAKSTAAKSTAAKSTAAKTTTKKKAVTKKAPASKTIK